MRIAMLTAPSTADGPLPALTPLLASALRDLGCEVEILPWGRRQEGESVWRKLVQRPADLWRARRRLDAQPVEVVVIHTAHSWTTLVRDIPLVLAARGRRRAVVLHFHGSYSGRLIAAGRPAFKLASSLLLAFSDAALVLSSEEQREWRAFHSRGRFEVVRNPVRPAPPLETAPARSRFAIPGTDPIALFVGRLIEAKGILDLVAALAAQSAAAPWHLLVVGDGPLEQEVRRRAAQAGVSSKLTLTGYLRGDDLRAAYQVADLLALPSYSEGLPLVVLEAMAAGLPIVTTGIRGMADHLRDGVNGRLVPPGDPAALAAALARLLGDGEERLRMGRANREQVAAFSPERVGCDYLAVLRAVVAARPARA
jgi:glycosyltransferase involved in cell wall biosynthesis